MVISGIWGFNILLNPLKYILFHNVATPTSCAQDSGFGRETAILELFDMFFITTADTHQSAKAV